MNQELCDYQGCQNIAHQYVYGHAYCVDHYQWGLEQAFLNELSLLGTRKPSNKLRNLFGRYVEGLYVSKAMPMPEELTGSKLKQRAEWIEYKNGKITFMIERHPTPIPLRQYWQFSLAQGVLEMLREESVYLDCSMAAEQLGKNQSTIRRYIKQGKLEAHESWEIEQINYWFEDKMHRGDIDTYNKRNRIMRPGKLLIHIDEINRFLRVPR